MRPPLDNTNIPLSNYVVKYFLSGWDEEAGDRLHGGRCG
jgi:hypothetical protein